MIQEKTVEKIIEETIIRMGKEFAKNEGYASVSDINHGECEVFQHWVVEELGNLLPDAEIDGVNIREYDFEEMGGHPEPFDTLLEMPYHAWFTYNGKNYDVEAPEGVDYWFQLPFYKQFSEMDKGERKEIFDSYNENSRSMQDWGLPDDERAERA